MRKWKPAPPDPGIIPGGIRDRAMQAALARGQQSEDKEKTSRSQEYWAKHRAAQVKRAGTAHQSHDPSEINQRPAKADSEVDDMRRFEGGDAVRE